jgi:hypothetical protein
MRIGIVRKLMVFAVALVGALTAQVAFALTTGTPAIGDVEATFTASQVGTPTLSTCTGAGGITYEKQLSRTWKGTITDMNPSAHPYPLTGKIKVVATFTINALTGEGVGVGTLTVTNGTTLVARGPFTLPTQITNPQTADAVARGMINIPLYTAGVKNGTNVIANFELSLNGSTNVISGFMGESVASPAVPDIAVEFNNRTC